MLNRYTEIDCEDFVAYNCNDCGAYSTNGVERIEHHNTCKYGNAEYWINFYSAICNHCKEDTEFINNRWICTVCGQTQR